MDCLHLHSKESSMLDERHVTSDELAAGIDAIRRSPKDEGVLTWIVRRPDADAREVLDVGELSTTDGLIGDNWKARGSSHAPNPDVQITVMNARVIALVARDRDRWQLAGDQLFVDLDLSEDNVPAGTRLCVGSAALEVSRQPHTGCKKFAARFGRDALQFINSPEGRRLRLRGLNARIVQAGTIRVGDVVTITRA